MSVKINKTKQVLPYVTVNGDATGTKLIDGENSGNGKHDALEKLGFANTIRHIGNFSMTELNAGLDIQIDWLGPDEPNIYKITASICCCDAETTLDITKDEKVILKFGMNGVYDDSRVIELEIDDVRNFNYDHAKISGVRHVDAFGVFDFEGASISRDGRPLWIQCGANSNQGIPISIGAVSSHTLGGEPRLCQINVLTPEDGTRALTSVHTAVSQVSGIRARLGASQNRLEHTVLSLQVSSENLSASESRVRDADMAKERMEYVKADILQQLGASMLTQTNMQSQSILRLLE